MELSAWDRPGDNNEAHVVPLAAELFVESRRTVNVLRLWLRSRSLADVDMAGEFLRAELGSMEPWERDQVLDDLVELQMVMAERKEMEKAKADAEAERLRRRLSS